MAQKVADPCRNCGAALAPGAAFCTLCGAAVPNRAASPAPSSVPVAGPQSNSYTRGGSGFVGQSPDSQSQTLPGIIPVGTTSAAPLLAPQQMGVDPRIAEATALVPGGAGRRLAAKVLDGILPGILFGVASLIGSLNIKVTQVGEFAQLDLTWLLVSMGIAGLLSLAYGIWLWLWEAKSGKTPGNLMVGLRTTNMDGHPAGLLPIFLRYLIIGVSNIVPTVGPLLVIISNAWDSNGKKQGWHDKVAHTLVFNVKAGRDPLETGGIAERENFSPASVPTISPVRSPLVGHGQSQAARAGGAPLDPFAPPVVHFQNRPAQQNNPAQQNSPAVPNHQAQQFPDQPAAAQPGQQGSPFAPPSTTQPEFPVEQGPITSVPGVSRNAPQEPAQQFNQPHAAAAHAAAAQADDEAGETRVRPVGQTQGLRLTFDDGRHEDVSAVALIGRNPAGYDGEMISRLISVQDSSRSVSKTHLHLRVSGEGLWVSDRNSTNGSGITRPGSSRTPVLSGQPALAEIGSTVHFGDRSFVVGRA